MKLTTSTVWTLLLVCLLTLSAGSVGVARAQTPGPPAGPDIEPSYDEAEAQAIDRMIMCPVCPAETIDQAQVPIARQMRQRVREMLAQGATREEVLSYFSERYGADILASPPKSGFNLVAWLLPPLALAAALAAGLLVLKSMSARRGAEPMAEAQSTEGLEPYLALVDQELAGSTGRKSDGSGGRDASGQAPSSVGTPGADGTGRER